MSIFIEESFHDQDVAIPCGEKSPGESFSPEHPQGRSEQPTDLSRVDLQRFREREHKFLLFRKDAKETLELSSLPKITIEQAYFPDDLVPAMAALAASIRGIGEAAKELTFSQARIRKITGDDSVQYYLQAKTRNPETGLSDRTEIPAAIDERAYAELLPLASAGRILKVRRLLSDVVGPDNNPIPVQVDIDRILEAGPNSEKPAKGKFSFYTVDVEVPSEKASELLRSGEHNIGFVHAAIELDEQNKNLRSLLSTRRIAAVGREKELLVALQGVRRALLKQAA